ncbi:MAG TPA: c-type cytochrome [Steroidobacteraceae bacterium]|nr:c-type cytochrome [Steroidobacteraceae bacterium]
MSDRATLTALICALLGAVLCAAFSPGIQAQVSADAAELARGEHIARLVCATCHVVARDQEYPPLLSKPAPSFLDLANRPGVSAESLERFVTTTHWDNPDKLAMTMPDLRATPEQSRAVARYILSLRKH